jgi:hypothetical protein
MIDGDRVNSVRYLPPFEVLKAFLTISSVNGQLHVTCRHEDLLNMLRTFLSGIQVDEAWYLERYPDIATAIGQGLVQSPQTHFVNDGYFEGRIPFPIRVDERFYLARNPGIADCVRQGTLQSGQQHFDENGYAEGRLPFGL